MAISDAEGRKRLMKLVEYGSATIVPRGKVDKEEVVKLFFELRGRLKDPESIEKINLILVRDYGVETGRIENGC